jgi:hypothetical protein
MVTFRAIASLTKRSDSWRMASLDIVGARGLRIVSSITQQFQVAKPETWPSFNLPVDALREPHPVTQGDHFGGFFTDHDRWRVGVAADHVGHDARICNTQVQYSHDPEPWIDHVADPAKEDRMAPLIVMLIVIASRCGSAGRLCRTNRAEGQPKRSTGRPTSPYSGGISARSWEQGRHDRFRRKLPSTLTWFGGGN